MLRDRADVKAALWGIAGGQRGYFTAAQAVEAGYSYQAQRYHAKRGNWTSVDRGIYRLPEFDVLPGGADDHLARWHLWSRGRATVSHATALSVHDLGTANPARVHLTVPPGFRQKNTSVVLHRADLAPDEIEDHGGYRMTTPVRAISEYAAAHPDQDELDSAVTEALSRGLVTRRSLLHAAQRLSAQAELGVERALRAVR